MEDKAGESLSRHPTPSVVAEHPLTEENIVELKALDPAFFQMIRENFVPQDQVPGKGQLRMGRVPGSPTSLPPLADDDIELEMFPEEIEAFREIKKNHADLCSHFTDRFIACALLQWYLDVEKAVKVLETNWTVRQKLGLLKLSDFPKLDDLIMGKNILEFCYAIPGARSTTGHAMTFGKIGNLVYPKNFEDKDAKLVSVYFCMILMESDRLDACRNGVFMFNDMKGMSMKQFNAKFEKAASEIYQDVFPVRFSLMAIMNPSLILRAILKICRLFLKKKMMDRIKSLPMEDVLKLAGAQDVPKDLGGQVDWSPEQYEDYLRKWEKGYCYHGTTEQ